MKPKPQGSKSLRANAPSSVPQVLPVGIGRSDTKGANTKLNDDLLKRLPDLLKNTAVRKAFCELKGDDAQSVIDYLDAILQQPLAAELHKDVIHTLYGICKASMLYPRCYVLKDVSFGTQVTGGGFSDIYQGRVGQEQLCLKVVRLFKRSDSEKMLKMFAKEAILWGNVHHPNIVPFYGIFFRDQAQKQVCLASPWFSNGNLIEHLKKKGPSESRFPYINDISLGLEYLHSQNLVHGDLKGVNVLVDGSGRACLTDFGLSAIRSDDSVAQSMATSTAQGISYRFAAPELVLSDSARSSKASDVWAFGCVCYEILHGRPPYWRYSDMQTLQRVMAGELPGDLSVTPNMDQANITVRRVVTECWSWNPGQRPESKEIVRRLGATRKREKKDDQPNPQTVQLTRKAMGSYDVSPDYEKVAQILNRIEKPLKAKRKPHSLAPKPKTTEEQTGAPPPAFLIVPSLSEASTSHSGLNSKRPLSLHGPVSAGNSPNTLAVPLPEPGHARRNSFGAAKKQVQFALDTEKRPKGDQTRPKKFEPSGFTFHPLLQPHQKSTPGALVFDLSSPDFLAKKAVTSGPMETLSRTELTEPASWPGLSQLRIECDLIPQWPLLFELDPAYFGGQKPPPGSRIPPISLGDVLIKLHDHFSKGVTQEEWATLSPEDQTTIAQSYTRRCKDQGQGEEQGKRQGVKRIDYCKGKVWFRGLTRSGDQKNVWKLQVDK